MSVSPTDLRKRFDQAQAKVKNGNYEEAIPDLTLVIDYFIVDNDGSANVKMSAFNSRCLCRTKLEDYEGAIRDADYTIMIYEAMRTPDRWKGGRDNLRPIANSALIMRGQAFEASSNVHDAIRSYRESMSFLPDGAGRSTLDQCLMSFGIPYVDGNDESLKPFSQVLDAISTAQELQAAFGKCVSFITSKGLDQDAIRRLESAKIPQLLIGAVNFQLSSSVCVDLGVTLAGWFIRHGCESAWVNHAILGKVFLAYLEDKTVAGDCISVLSTMPRHLQQFFGQKEYMEGYLKLFALGLSDKDVAELFLITYRVLEPNDPSVEPLKGSRIVEHCLTAHTPNAAMLMAKLTLNEALCREIKANSGALVWFFDLLMSEQKEKLVIECALVALKQLAVPEGEGEWSRENYALTCFDRVVPFIRKYRGVDLDFVRIAFQLLGDVIEFAVDKAAEHKIALLASLMLVTNMDRHDFAGLMVKFLWRAVTFNLVEEGQKEVMMKNMLRAGEVYPKDAVIKELSIAFCVTLNHPKKMELLQQGLRVLPKSDILKNLCNQPDIMAVLKQRLMHT
jgi:hypothetical protein